MFEYLKGKAVEITPAYAVIDINGVGYFVRISMVTYEKIQSAAEVLLYIEFIVREDGHYLYGFYDKNERELFRQLISVSGIGSSSAMLVLSALSPSQLAEAIVNEDVATLKSIKGIGPKTAKRLIVELKDKMLKNYQGDEVLHVPGGSHHANEAITALEVLGYPRKVTAKLIRQILKENPSLETEQIIKTALKRL
jgi:Holliday junction DNA helicase RuvA